LEGEVDLEGLGINLPTLVAQIINFAILFGLLYIVAYKPILKMFDERSSKIKESMEETERIKEQAARTDEEVKEHLENARKDGQAIIAQAAKMGEQVKEEARGRAREEAEAVISRAQGEIRRERDEAIGELRKEFADIAIMAAGKVINEELDKAKHKRLIEEVLEESTAMKGD
jgi:F-type H+-transporting ATPase subunit b